MPIPIALEAPLEADEAPWKPMTRWRRTASRKSRTEVSRRSRKPPVEAPKPKAKAKAKAMRKK